MAAAIEVGWDLESSRAAVGLAAEHPGFLFPTAGIHPHYAGDAPPNAMDILRELAPRPRSGARSGTRSGTRLVAIGETGLDFYRNLSPRRDQEEFFRRHIRLAREVGLPLVVHSREAMGRVLAILEEEKAGEAGGVLHCFSGTRAEAQRALDLGFHLGIGGTLTYDDASELERVVREAPPDRLLIETDSPYLSPEPHRRERNEPARLRVVRDRLAELRGSGAVVIALETRQNAERLFRLPVAARHSAAGPTPEPG